MKTYLSTWSKSHCIFYAYFLSVVKKFRHFLDFLELQCHYTLLKQL